MSNSLILNIYYLLKPLIPRRMQILVRAIQTRRKLQSCSEVWPIDEQACMPPHGWAGWPEQKRFALVLTHDVDTAQGQSKCDKLAKIEKELGFRSSFNFVPERYKVSQELRKRLVENGFEIGIHGLNHDGKLYNSREIFKERVTKINRYIKKWGVCGFRSPSMHSNLEWLHDLDIEYDASTFDTDPFEPRSDGVNSIFPFTVQNSNKNKYVELPYTLPQDFTLFILMKEKTTDIWKEKLDWIVEKRGMVLVNVHPDYINFNGRSSSAEEYPVEYYIEILEYIREKYNGQYWHALPRNVARFWAKESPDNDIRDEPRSDKKP